jgi:hypothetical protein
MIDHKDMIRSQDLTPSQYVYAKANTGRRMMMHRASGHPVGPFYAPLTQYLRGERIPQDLKLSETQTIYGSLNLTEPEGL